MDVDDFKIINDMYGHGVGDKVLKHLAESMRDTFSDNAILGRNGGDEFCILLKDCNVEDMRQKIEGFCKMTVYSDTREKNIHIAFLWDMQNIRFM